MINAGVSKGDLKELILNNLSIGELENLVLEKKKELYRQKDLRDNESLMKQYLDTLNSVNTRIGYEQAIKNFMKFKEHENLQLSTKLDLEKYFTYLNLNKEKKRKRKSKMLFWAGINSFFRHFIHLQGIDTENEYNLNFIEDPTSNIKRNWKKDDERTIFEILTIDEIKQVLFALKYKPTMNTTPKDFMMFYVLANTSMRRMGLCNIKIKDIHLDERYLLTFEKGKMRTYIFGEQMKEELKNFITLRQRASSIYKNSEYLFVSNKGKKYADNTISSHLFPKVAKVIKEITEKKVTAHDLRRAFETNRLNMGQSYHEVDNFLNHENDDLKKAYYHPTIEIRRRDFDKFNTF